MRNFRHYHNCGDESSYVKYTIWIYKVVTFSKDQSKYFPSS